MRSRAVRYAGMLLLQALLAVGLLAFGAALTAASVALAAVAAVLLVLVNTLGMTRLAGFEDSGGSRRAGFATGIAVGTAVACAGAGLSTQGLAWAVLTLAGLLFNMELIAMLARLPAAHVGIDPGHHCCLQGDGALTHDPLPRAESSEAHARSHCQRDPSDSLASRPDQPPE
jgi:hypothetical protein